MESLKHFLRKILRYYDFEIPKLLKATYWDNQIYFTFYAVNGNQLNRNVIENVTFDKVSDENQNSCYNILSDQLPFGSTPHISSDSNDKTLVLNWHVGRHGTQYIAYNFNQVYQGNTNMGGPLYGFKPRSGIISATSYSNDSSNMVSPEKANFFYVVWLTVNYIDGPSTYRLVLAQHGTGSHVLKKLEAVASLAHSGWDVYEGKIKGALKELKDGTEDAIKGKSKNIWYVAVAGDYGAPPSVPNPPFGTKMLPVYVHEGDGSNSFNDKSLHLICCDINGKNPIAIKWNGTDDSFKIIFLNSPTQ